MSEHGNKICSYRNQINRRKAVGANASCLSALIIRPFTFFGSLTCRKRKRQKKVHRTPVLGASTMAGTRALEQCTCETRNVCCFAATRRCDRTLLPSVYRVARIAIVISRDKGHHSTVGQRAMTDTRAHGDRVAFSCDVKDSDSRVRDRHGKRNGRDAVSGATITVCTRPGVVAD